MRIIAGSLKGRQFDSPAGHRTHPMSEKIRGAIFNILGDVEEMTLFDAFAGSGAFAFEAISRGAKSALMTDITKEAYAAIQKNIVSLELSKEVKVVRANASGWSDNNLNARFDIVLADPPYDDVQQFLLEKLARHVKTNGLYVLSLPPSEQFIFPGFKLIKQKAYGDATLSFYRRGVDNSNRSEVK